MTPTCQELYVGNRRRRRATRHARWRQYVAVVRPRSLVPQRAATPAPRWAGFLTLQTRRCASLTALAWHWWRHREKYFRPRDVKSRTRAALLLAMTSQHAAGALARWHYVTSSVHCAHASTINKHLSVVIFASKTSGPLCNLRFCDTDETKLLSIRYAMFIAWDKADRTHSLYHTTI